jgi:hypothetical protein
MRAMLNAPNDIYDTKPPFLILLGDGSWRVALELFPCTDGVGYIEPFAEQASHESPSGVLPGAPWHVGDELWELDHNARIMTLDHPHNRNHPAWRLWLHWLSSLAGGHGNRQH